MPAIDRREFATKHIKNAEGVPYSFTHNDWIQSAWDALDGWKLWPKDPDRLCDFCSELANSIVPKYTTSDKTRTNKHKAEHDDCQGLTSEPVLFLGLNVVRQDGKTFGVAGWVLERLFKGRNESICMIGIAEDQVTRIFNANYRDPIVANPKLERASRIVGNKIFVEGKTKGNKFEVLPTSLSSVGGSMTVVLIEEARAVPGEIAVAMLPTLAARGGWECHKGHVKTFKGVDDPGRPKKCSVCKSKLQPWYGKAIICSSAGELKDTDDDWWAEFVDIYSSTPHQNVHLIVQSENTSTKVAQKTVGAIQSAFGALDSLRMHVDIETGNQFRQKGDDFLKELEVKAATDTKLKNLNSVITDPCVAFLDTSYNTDLTTLVVLADDTLAGAQPWEHVYQAHVKIWDPKDHGGIIDDAEIQRYLDRVMPFFPGLMSMGIDTRGSSWAPRLVRALTKTKPRRWAKLGKLKAWDKQNKESQLGWDLVEELVKAQPPRIRLQAINRQALEFKGVKRAPAPRGSNRGAKGPVVDRNRRKMHMDITESLACCCYQVSEILLGVTTARTNRRFDRDRTRQALQIKPVMSGVVNGGF